MEETTSYSVRPGYGPRTLAFDREGKKLYASCEMGNRVIALSVGEGDSGELGFIQDADLGISEVTTAAECSVVGDMVMVANRISVADTAAFAGEPKTGSLSLYAARPSGELQMLGHASTMGVVPRHFT